MEKRRSFVEPPSGTLSRSASRQSVSTRMKKVAPPPPPTEKAPLPPLSNGSVRRSLSADPCPPRNPLQSVLSTPGEDCAIDELLEGRMDLEVVLPDLKIVRMTVDRKTPMMDLLVQATTSNKISPGGHIINLISKDERNVHYKPNTPIGALDANTVYIIPKSTLELPVKRMPKLANQPFEQTFRLQVNLPHNQRMVLRVSPRITLDELKKQICSEKELDFSSHHLVHPAHPDTILDLNATLEFYGCAEISLMSNSGLRDSIRNSATYFTQPPRLEEEKRKKGILRLFSRRNRKDFTTETPSNGVNHLPSSQSDGGTLNRNSYQPKQSSKRKPAPAPPPNRNSSPPLITQSSNSINSRPESEISVKTADEIESSVSHSRHSSDSSGYHEPSIFSDCSENKSPEASIVHGDHGYVSDVHRQSSPLQKDNIENSVQMKRSSMTARDSNLKNVPSCSNVSISSASRKRKAPQPPVSNLPAIESPSSPDAPPIDSVVNTSEETESKIHEASGQEQQENDSSDASHSVGNEKAAATEIVKNTDSQQQETEALQYLEDVLQESEKLQSPRVLDDSDTDSLKDEGQVISVCQAEVHANATDHDSPDSVVESPTVVASAPESQNTSFAPLSNPISQSVGCEVVDTSADDSGISQSLNSDADSSVPSLNSDYKTMSDSGCQEDIYCNVTESADPKLVPSDTELPAQNSSAEIVNTQNYESPVCDGANLKSSDTESFGESEQLSVDQQSLSSDTNKQSVADDSAVQKNAFTAPKPVSEKVKIDKVNGDKSSASSVSSGSHQNSTTVTPQCRKKLDNFVLSSYKKDDIEDIYSLPTDLSKKSSENSCLVNNSDEKYEVEVPKRKYKSQPDVKIVSLKENTPIDVFESSESNSGRVHEKCAQLSKINTLPLTGRCSSMYSLTPPQKMQMSTSEAKKEVVTEESMKRTQSDQNISNDLQAVDLKACFLQEQRRLQEEYQRLQAQFISWQKQLMNNQSLLQNENILPQMPFTSLAGLENLENTTKKTVSENLLNSKDESVPFDQYKTRSLPRPKTKSLSLKEPSRPKTPPIPSSPTETSVVDIDIGSEVAKRPETLTSCSVDTQAEINVEDKVTQIPSPQDKVTQVPSPQEKVTSGTQVPSPETVKSKEDVSAQTSNQNLASPTESAYSDSEGSKSQTLPRPKPKPIGAFQPTQTMTLNRKSMPKSQAVSVTIGSWQQRQSAITDIEPTNVASSRSKFQSLESIPQGSSIKSVPSFMEKRKLPPVPIEKSPANEDSHATKPKQSEAIAESKALKIVKESLNPSGKPNKVPEETAVKAVLSASKPSSAAVPRVEETSLQKLDIKHAAKEPTAVFKSVKPFIKMSSMKDESHTPSIIGLRKWPLSDISENKGMGEGRQSILDDMKASSKRPGGFVQDKIRRAEVDLRKPRSSKIESSVPKSKEANVESAKPKPSRAESTSETEVKETTVQPSKLHITKVSITSVKKSSENTKPPAEKKYTSNVTTPVSAPSSATWANTIPKSHSLNSELLAAFTKKANKDTERYKEIGTAKVASEMQSIKVNGSVQPPPPPPPPPLQSPSSTMPTIPPAEQIPVSSQLLMAKGTTTVHVTKKGSKKSPTKFSRTADPREELMLEIRGFGGKHALRKLYEKSCLNLLKKSPKKKKAIPEDSSSSSKLK